MHYILPFFSPRPPFSERELALWPHSLHFPLHLASEERWRPPAEATAEASVISGRFKTALKKGFWCLIFERFCFLYTKKLKTQFVKTAVSQTFLNFELRRFLSSCGWGSVVAERTEKLFSFIIKPSFQNPGGGCQ